MRIVFFSVLILLFTACQSENDPNKSETGNDVSSIVATDKPEVVTDDDRFREIASSNSSNPVAEDSKLTQIQYTEERHNFGNVFYPSENKYTFRFKNTGKVPLIIESATASCGCTIPNKPDEPIAPGAIGELDVIFRPKKGQVGQPVEKKITVVANTEPKETYLYISATVLEAM